MRFLATYSLYKPVIEPEDFDVCPILLTHPEDLDAMRLSELYLKELSHDGKVFGQRVISCNCVNGSQSRVSKAEARFIIAYNYISTSNYLLPLEHTDMLPPGTLLASVFNRFPS